MTKLEEIVIKAKPVLKEYIKFRSVDIESKDAMAMMLSSTKGKNVVDMSKPVNCKDDDETQLLVNLSTQPKDQHPENWGRL